MLLSRGFRWIFPWMVAALGTVSAAELTVTVHEPWVAEGPPGASVLAGYLELRNSSEDARYVVRVTSARAERVEIHQSEMREGMARMIQQESLAIPARGQVSLEPGGLHLMLIRPEVLRVGDQVPLTLELDDGTEVSLSAVVRKRGAQNHHQHHHHH